MQEPDKRFTYCSSYNSAAVVPVNLEALQKQEVEESVSAWQTGDGFVYPGVETATKSNVHPRKPDQARIDELEEVCHEGGEVVWEKGCGLVVGEGLCSMGELDQS